MLIIYGISYVCDLCIFVMLSLSFILANYLYVWFKLMNYECGLVVHMFVCFVGRLGVSFMCIVYTYKWFHCLCECIICIIHMCNLCACVKCVIYNLCTIYVHVRCIVYLHGLSVSLCVLLGSLIMHVGWAHLLCMWIGCF